MSNSLKRDIDDALNSGKVIVSVSINGNDYPGKMYSRSPWILLIGGAEIKIYNNRDKKVLKNISTLDITKINLRVAKGFNNAPGIFMTQSLCLEMDVRINNKNYCLICEDLRPIPEILKWLKENNIFYIDSYNLEQLYNENDVKEVVNILYSKIQEIQER